MIIEKTISIIATGKYLPKTRVSSTDIDISLQQAKGFTKTQSGIVERYYAKQETASEMAKEAIFDALNRADLTIEEIDCLISASGTQEQAIPCNAAIVSPLLKSKRPIPCFDINMTCLGGLMALDVAASFIKTNKYKRVLIYASDIASVGIDWQNPETAALFGDGAAAIILGADSDKPLALFKNAHFATFSEGLNFCEIKGGGTKRHPSLVSENYVDLCLFSMQGRDIYKLASKKLMGFLEELLANMRLDLADIDWVVPHQASLGALKHIQKKVKKTDEQFINIIKTHGNQIAASILTALHELFLTKEIKSGQKILLLGTGAGLSMGAVILEK